MRAGVGARRGGAPPRAGRLAGGRRGRVGSPPAASRRGPYLPAARGAPASHPLPAPTRTLPHLRGHRCGKKKKKDKKKNGKSSAEGQPRPPLRAAPPARCTQRGRAPAAPIRGRHAVRPRRAARGVCPTRVRVAAAAAATTAATPVSRDGGGGGGRRRRRQCRRRAAPAVASRGAYAPPARAGRCQTRVSGARPSPSAGSPLVARRSPPSPTRRTRRPHRGGLRVRWARVPPARCAKQPPQGGTVPHTLRRALPPPAYPPPADATVATGGAGDTFGAGPPRTLRLWPPTPFARRSWRTPACHQRRCRWTGSSPAAPVLRGGWGKETRTVAAARR